jgi:hypothetical protein
MEFRREHAQHVLNRSIITNYGNQKIYLKKIQDQLITICVKKAYVFAPTLSTHCTVHLIIVELIVVQHPITGKISTLAIAKIILNQVEEVQLNKSPAVF